MRPEHGGAGFNAQRDAEFVQLVRQAVIVRDDASGDQGAVSKAIEHRYDLDVFRRIIFTESHDEVANGRARVPEEIWPGKVDSWFSKKRSTLGGALVLTSPGIPTSPPLSFSQWILQRIIGERPESFRTISLMKVGC